VAFGVTTTLLIGAAWPASYPPARRSMRVDPVEAVRRD
jgi:ABC-type lipoprotein release transport system permease subunit